MIVKGERNGQQVTYIRPTWRAGWPGTGLPASIAALMLAASDVTVKGVVAPEGCIDPEKFLTHYCNEALGIHQTETITSMLAI